MTITNTRLQRPTSSFAPTTVKNDETKTVAKTDKPVEKPVDTLDNKAPTTKLKSEPQMPKVNGDVDTKALYSNDDTPTELKREDFVTEMADKKMSVKTAIPGVDASRADLNADGVISGKEEWSEMFSRIDAKESKGKGGRDVADLTQQPVSDALNAVRAAPGDATGKARYSAAELQGMSNAMKGAMETLPTQAKPGTDYIGRKLSKDAISTGMFAGWGGNSAEVVHDPKLGFLKRQGDGPLVPMTPSEVKDFAARMKESGPPNPMESGSEQHVKLWNRMFPKEAVGKSEECST
jgi:hypothetical protein